MTDQMTKARTTKKLNLRLQVWHRPSTATLALAIALSLQIDVASAQFDMRAFGGFLGAMGAFGPPRYYGRHAQRQRYHHEVYKAKPARSTPSYAGATSPAGADAAVGKDSPSAPIVKDTAYVPATASPGTASNNGTGGAARLTVPLDVREPETASPAPLSSAPKQPTAGAPPDGHGGSESASVPLPGAQTNHAPAAGASPGPGSGNFY
jgi:hypothetical protein